MSESILMRELRSEASLSSPIRSFMKERELSGGQLKGAGWELSFPSPLKRRSIFQEIPEWEVWYSLPERRVERIPAVSLGREVRYRFQETLCWLHPLGSIDFKSFLYRVAYNLPERGIQASSPETRLSIACRVLSPTKEEQNAHSLFSFMNDRKAGMIVKTL